MANEFYGKFMEQLALGAINMQTAVFRLMLEEEASTYVYDWDHEFVDDLSGFVEVSAAGYSRQNLANKAVQVDSGNSRIELVADPVSWAGIASGQRIDRGILYVQTGGDDSTPGNDILIMKIDETTGLALPLLTNGGAVSLTFDAQGLIQLRQGS